MPFRDAYPPGVPAALRRPGAGSPGLAALLGLLIGTLFGGFGLVVVLAGGPPDVGKPQVFQFVFGGVGAVTALGGYTMAFRALLHARRLRRLGTDVISAHYLDSLAERHPELSHLAARAQVATERVRTSRAHREGWLPLTAADLDRAQWSVLSAIRTVAAGGERPESLTVEIDELERLAAGVDRLASAQVNRPAPTPPADLGHALATVEELERYARES